MAAKRVSLKVLNHAGEETGKVMVSAEVFGVEVNEQVMFDAVQVYQSNMRQATAKTLTRAEVSGGGKKPWRQKGTQTLLCGLRRLFPPRSCGKKGGHDHAKKIQHTPPQPRCENPAVRR